jgi:hypothetical protein
VLGRISMKMSSHRAALERGSVTQPCAHRTLTLLRASAIREPGGVPFTLHPLAIVQKALDCGELRRLANADYW